MANIIGSGKHQMLALLDGMRDEAAVSKNEYSREWDRFLDFAKGKQWEKNRRNYKSDVVINLIELIIERETGLITDSRPQINVFAKRKEQAGAARILKDSIQSVWDRRNIEQNIAELVQIAGTFGSGGFGITFDPLIDHGYGDIDLPILDPRNVLFDPWLYRAKDIDRQCMYFINETVLPLDLIRERFPGEGRKVKSESQYSRYESSKKTKKLNQYGPTPFKRRQDNLMESAYPKACVREYYILDGTINETKETIKMGNILIKPGQKLFGGGRHIFTAGDIILIDEPNPFIDGQMPLEWYDWRRDIGSPWGRSEVSVLMNVQKNLNKMTSSMMENAIAMGNGWVVGDQDALTPEQWNKIRADEPGLIIKKRSQRELRRDYPPPLPNASFQIVQLFTQMMEQLSGISEVGAGKRPTQLASGVAMESLSLQAQVLLRIRARQMESFLSRCFQKVISRIFQFYTEDRLFHLIGDTGEVRQFDFIRKDLMQGTKDPSKAFRDFEFVITPGSSLSMSKVQKSQLAMSLFQAGLIDDQAVMEAVEFPNWENVLARTMAKKAAMPQPPPKTGARKLKGPKKGAPPLQQPVGEK